MEPRTLQFIVEACQGELLRGSPDAVVPRVCTDSRQVQPGDLFLALRGDAFDGHDFLDQSSASGASAALVAPTHAARGGAFEALITAPNPRAALGRLAAGYRRQFSPVVIAVGGSNGKTTTKQILSTVLSQALPTLVNEASFNNDIGVPLTLLRLETRHRAAILEVGTNHPGELAPLLAMVRPEFGVLTSIGREHLEFFGDLQGVAREEGTLAELLPASGVLFINSDTPMAEAICSRSSARVVRVGGGENADWRLYGMRVSRSGTRFRLAASRTEWTGEYKIALLGRHQALNAALAIAVAAELGLSRQQVEAGLLACQPARMRLQAWDLRGATVLDDAYNANADSMNAALETLQELPCKGRRIAVLGDMAELGEHSEAAHEEIGRKAAQCGVDQLFAVGSMAPVFARGARGAGLNRVMEFPDAIAAAVAVRSFLREGDVLLLKASRSLRLERLSELLRQPDGGRN